MMLADSPNCCRSVPSVARYFSGQRDQRAERQQHADDEGEHAVDGEEAWSRLRRYRVVVAGRRVRLLRGGDVAHLAPPDERRERAEDPPLEGVEQVAQGGERGPRRGAAPGRPARGRRCPGWWPRRRVDDGVGAVEVLVDVLDQVGRADLREYVVGRVGVGLARSPRTAAARRPARPCRSGGAGAASTSATQPRTTGSAGSSASPDGQRGDHPEAVGAVVLAARTRRPSTPAARCRSTRTGCPTWSPGNGSSGPITSASGSGSSWVRSTRSSARRSCHASYCQ